MRYKVFDLLIMVSIYSEVCHPHLLPYFGGPGEAIKKVRQGDIEQTNRPRISAAAVFAAKNEIEQGHCNVVAEDTP